MFTTLALAAACTFSDSALLGEWSASSVSVERANHTYETCARLDLRLSCAPNNELRVEWRYRCGTFMDWDFGGVRQFPVADGKLLGQDGHISAEEFYWDGLVPRVGGSKFSIKGSGFEIGEDPKYYYPEYTYRGTLKPAPGLNWNEPQMFAADKLNGKWTGKIRIIFKDYDTGAVKSEKSCRLPELEIDHRRGRIFQTHVYSPDCQGQNVNYYFGPHYFRGGDVYGYPPDNSGSRLIVRGKATPEGYTSENPHYGINKEEAVFHPDGTVTIKLISKVYDMTMIPFEHKWTEYWLELHRP